MKLILSYRACRYDNLDTLNSKIHQLLAVLEQFRKKVTHAHTHTRTHEADFNLRCYEDTLVIESNNTFLSYKEFYITS